MSNITKRDLIRRRAELRDKANTLLADTSKPFAEQRAEVDSLIDEADRITHQLELMVEDTDTAPEDERSAAPAVVRAAHRSKRVSQPAALSGERFSVQRAIRSMAEGKPLDGIEGDMSALAAGDRGLRANTFCMPFQTRANEVTTSTGAGLVTTTYADDFIQILRKASLIEPLGLRTIMAPMGNYRLPRETTNTQASWMAEGGQSTNSPLAVDFVEVSPLLLQVEVQVTRTLLYSSGYDANAIIEADITSAIGEKLNAAIVNGTGTSNQPTGALNNSGVTSVALASAPTYAWADALNLEANILAGNPPAGSPIKYLTSPFGQQKLKATAKLGSTFPEFVMEDGSINGKECVVSNHVPSNLTVSPNSNLTALVGGCWSEAVNVVMWNNGVDILVDPYSAADMASVRVFAYLFCNLLWRRPSLLRTQYFG